MQRYSSQNNNSAPFVEVCRYFAYGACARGKDCRYAHVEDAAVIFSGTDNTPTKNIVPKNPNNDLDTYHEAAATKSSTTTVGNDRPTNDSTNSLTSPTPGALNTSGSYAQRPIGHSNSSRISSAISPSWDFTYVPCNCGFTLDSLKDVYQSAKKNGHNLMANSVSSHSLHYHGIGFDS